MSLYSRMQICGKPKITVKLHEGVVWVSVKDGPQTITMEAKHVRALDQALNAFLGQQAASVIAVDAAEPAEGV